MVQIYDSMWCFCVTFVGFSPGGFSPQFRPDETHQLQKVGSTAVEPTNQNFDTSEKPGRNQRHWNSLVSGFFVT